MTSTSESEGLRFKVLRVDGPANGTGAAEYASDLAGRGTDEDGGEVGGEVHGTGGSKGEDREKEDAGGEEGGISVIALRCGVVCDGPEEDDGCAVSSETLASES